MFRVKCRLCVVVVACLLGAACADLAAPVVSGGDSSQSVPSLVSGSNTANTPFNNLVNLLQSPGSNPVSMPAALTGVGNAPSLSQSLPMDSLTSMPSMPSASGGANLLNDLISSVPDTMSTGAAFETPDLSHLLAPPSGGATGILSQTPPTTLSAPDVSTGSLLPSMTITGAATASMPSLSASGPAMVAPTEALSLPSITTATGLSSPPSSAPSSAQMPSINVANLALPSGMTGMPSMPSPSSSSASLPVVSATNPITLPAVNNAPTASGAAFSLPSLNSAPTGNIGLPSLAHP